MSYLRNKIPWLWRTKEEFVQGEFYKTERLYEIVSTIKTCICLRRYIQVASNQDTCPVCMTGDEYVEVMKQFKREHKK